MNAFLVAWLCFTPLDARRIAEELERPTLSHFDNLASLLLAHAPQIAGLPSSVTRTASPSSRLHTAALMDAQSGEVELDPAQDLRNKLKGIKVCIFGVGPRKSAIGKRLAERLNYDHFDVEDMIREGFEEAGGTKGMSMEDMCDGEPLETPQMITKLGHEFMQPLQLRVESVITNWAGGALRERDVAKNESMPVSEAEISTADMVHDSITLHIEEPSTTRWSGLHPGLLDEWNKVNAQANANISVAEDTPLEEAVSEAIEAMLKRIAYKPIETQWERAASKFNTGLKK